MKNVFLLIILTLLSLIGFLVYNKLAEPTTAEINTTNIDSSRTVHEAPKTEAQVYAETGLKVFEIGLEKLDEHKENKKYRDSIYRANRKPIWVYQIGSFKSDVRDFEEAYKKLSEAGVTNIYVMKQSHKSFYLVKNDDVDSQEELITKLSEVQSLVSEAGLSEIVKVKDLHEYCELEDAVADGNVKVAHKVRVECYSCK